jgi:hypothetical protein
MSKTYTVCAFEDNQWIDLGWSQLLLPNAISSAREKARTSDLQTAVFDGQRMKAGPYERRIITTVDGTDRAVKSWARALGPGELLQGVPAVVPAVRWVETSRLYEPGERVAEAA